MVNVSKRPEYLCQNVNCNNTFAPHHSKQKYCSRACIPPKGRAHLVCPCGESTGSYQKKYCSPEHRAQWQSKKPAARMIKHTCLVCKKDFERPHFYPGKKMFCSLKCSNQEHSRKRAKHYKFGELNLNGSYELRFVACLERFNVEWEPWPDDRPLLYGGHEYRPDFLVNGWAVEVKGWDGMNDQADMRANWDMPEPLLYIDRERLGRLERFFTQKQFLEALEFMDA